MTNIELYNAVSKSCSKKITVQYSTSFSYAIKLLHDDLRQPIYNIYGFVRLADEIVDTFHAYNKQKLFADFKQQTNDALQAGISLNPMLHSFQQTVATYKIDTTLIDDFLYSMQLDLEKKTYSNAEYKKYIYGSAEAVGLMCLKVFCNGDDALYNQLIDPAKSLGSAFQKVNFLRDMSADNVELGRMYFPDCDIKNFSPASKLKIEQDIENDFRLAYEGIKQLPVKARLGVYIAYRYYYKLYKKIAQTPASKILKKRIRIPNYIKALIVAQAGLEVKLNLV